mgnify:CR=1 FL=1
MGSFELYPIIKQSLHIADKLLKVPAKRTPDVLRWILTDFEFNRAKEEDFFAYYDRQTKNYFYQNKKTPVQTVSVSQASKPIYKSSVNSNHGFSEYLTEMFKILDTKS